MVQQADFEVVYWLLDCNGHVDALALQVDADGRRVQEICEIQLHHSTIFTHTRRVETKSNVFLGVSINAVILLKAQLGDQLSCQLIGAAYVLTVLSLDQSK